MKNRRIGPDTILNIITGISIISWIILAVIFLILAMSNPTSPGLSAARAGLKSAGQWTTSAIYALLIFLVILSVSEIVFNMMRMKRKSDKMRLTPFISGILSVLGLIILNFK